MRNILRGGIVLLIIVTSYFLYSFSYSASFNSDGAIQVLMTYFLDFPRDLYYWGQDRWGSVIPLLSQFFYKVFHLSPLNSVSITYYILLIGGYLGFASLLKSSYGKIIFAIIFFLPPLRFVDVLWYPIGIQYSLLGISILVLKQVDFSGRNMKNFFLLFILSIVFIFSQWVSDAAFITIFLLVLIHALMYWKDTKIKFTIFIFSIFTIVAGYYFINYGKENAIFRTTNYLGLNNFHNVFESINKIGDAFKGLLLVQGRETFMSIYAYLSILLIVLIIYFIIKRGIPGNMRNNRWIYLFLMDGLIAITVAIASKWVFMNDVNRRYFFGSYISLSFSVLLLLERIRFVEYELRIVKLALATTVLIGAISTPYYFKFVWLKSLKPQAKIFSEISKLAPAGIIAEYWHSYIAAAPDPSGIIATPKDDDLVRNPELAEKVFSQPNIYIIRNDWMDLFPDTINEFGRTLLKDGEQFTLSDCYICKYKVSR